MSLLHQSIISHPRAGTRENHYFRWYPKSLTKFSSDRFFIGGEIQGVYIHVPFCDKLCTFCPFIRGISNDGDISHFVEALGKEIDLYSILSTSKRLSFIYFGGGTPSVLTPSQLTIILDKLNKVWGIDSQTEISLETHPSHAVPSRLKDFRGAGVNRVSMGIQSFDQANLIKLGATHDEYQSRQAVDNAGTIFDNFAVDLLYSYEGQSQSSWNKDLEISLDLCSVPHISCYPIIPVSQKVRIKSLSDEIHMALTAIEKTNKHGLIRYASCSSGGFDTSRPDKICKYEKSHWAAPQSRFIGLGPGAFGFLENYTTTNTPRTKDYVSLIMQKGILPLVSLHEILESEQKHRYFSLGVKTYVVPFAPYIEQFAESPINLFHRQFDLLCNEGLAIMTNDSFELTETGKLYVDDCSSVFFSNEQKEIPHPEEYEITLLNKVKNE